VYLAHALKHDRQVAIKVLRENLTASLGSGRFLREIKIAAKLQHPHTLSLLDSGEADSFLFYVMPYVQGETLRDKLNQETQFGRRSANGGKVSSKLSTRSVNAHTLTGRKATERFRQIRSNAIHASNQMRIADVVTPESGPVRR
jgi:serine/threonine-protein kinase